MQPLFAGLLIFTLTAAQTATAQTASDIAATCRAMKNTESSGEGNDYPGMPNTVWRCMNGSVYICEMGATGEGCIKTGHSTAPHKGIIAWCRQNPNSDFVPSAYMAGSPASWRCQGTRPVIIETEGVDEGGYLKQFWQKVGK
jgi:hypothetical protein